MGVGLLGTVFLAYDAPVSKHDKDISISRAVGQFFGHLWGASTRPVKKDGPQRREVGRETTQAEGLIDGKKVVLRRTTIDEVEVHEGRAQE